MVHQHGVHPARTGGEFDHAGEVVARNYRGGFFRKTNNVVTNKEIQIVRPHSQQKIVYNMKRNDGPKKRCRTIDSESNDYTNTILIHCVLLVVVLIKDINRDKDTNENSVHQIDRRICLPLSTNVVLRPD
jgi:hypothetical protein